MFQEGSPGGNAKEGLGRPGERADWEALTESASLQGSVSAVTGCDSQQEPLPATQVSCKYYLESFFRSHVSLCCQTLTPSAAPAFENHRREEQPLFSKGSHLHPLETEVES